MSKGFGFAVMVVMLLAGSMAVAQDDQSSSSSAAPAPAVIEPQNVEPFADENPPISGVDQPSLEPHSAPESFLLPGLHFSESLESNVANTVNGSGVTSVTRGLASLTLQKLWKTDEVAMDYFGGASYYSQGFGLQQLQQFDIDNRINWRRGQLGVQDSFSYLPEGTFGFGAYGGGGAYSSGLGSLGSGLLGASAFGGQNSVFAGGNGIGVSLGLVPQLMNLGLADVVEELSPKSSVTLTGGYGLVHFYGSLIEQSALGGALQQNVNFVGSSEYSAQVAYDRTLNPKDQFAISYGYQYFHFSIAGTAFHSQVVQAMYGHRISGRMDLLISAGPQITGFSEQVCDLPTIPTVSCASFGGTLSSIGISKVGVAGRASLRYRFPKTSLSLSYQRYDTSGSGIFAGAETNLFQFAVARPLTRTWDLFGDVGYAKNSELQSPGSVVNATSFTNVYAGVGLHRQLNRSLRAFLSYQFNDLSLNNTCTVATVACNNISHNQVGSFGLDWTPRPIRLD